MGFLMWDAVGLTAMIEKLIHESERALLGRLHAQRSRLVDYHVSLHEANYPVKVYALRGLPKKCGVLEQRGLPHRHRRQWAEHF